MEYFYLGAVSQRLHLIEDEEIAMWLAEHGHIVFVADLVVA